MPASTARDDASVLAAGGAAFEAVLAQLTEGVIVTDADGRITYVNEAAARLHGVVHLDVDPESYAGTYQLFTEDGQPYPSLELPLARAARRGEWVREARWRIRRPDGSEIVAVGSARPLHAHDGRRVGAVLTLRDDTARSAAAAASREVDALSARLRAAFEQSPASTVVYDAAGRPVAVNPAFERLWGARLADVPPGYSVLTDPQLEAAGVLPQIARAFAGEVVSLPPVRYEMASTVGRGEVLWTRGHLYPVRDHAGVVEQVVLTHEDVTARQEAESALARQSALTRLVADNATAALFMMDRDGHPTYMNAAAEAMTGFTLDEIAWMPLHYAIHHRRPDGSPYPMSECPIDRALPEHFDVRAHEDVFVRKDGTFFPVICAASPILDDGVPVGTVVEVRDMTAAHAAEAERERLLAAERAARTAAETAARRTAALHAVATALGQALTPQDVADVFLAHALPIVGAGTGSVAVLDAMQETLHVIASKGYDTTVAAQYMRLPLDMRFPLTDAVRERRAILLDTAAARDAHYPHLAALRRANGGGGMAAVPLMADGRAVGALGLNFAGDRRIEGDDAAFLEAVAAQCAQALERARLFAAEHAARAEAEAANRAKSEFLSTMSHELRTPLNAIAGYTELLTLGLRGPVTPEQVVDLDRVRRASQHLMGLVTDILNFARLEAGQVEFHVADVPLAPIVADLETLLGPQISARGITFVQDACADGGTGDSYRVRADAEKVRQILLNLLTNAGKFTPAGGRVTLSCDADRAAGVVRVHVSDTGRGIPADQLERIFEPFVQVDRHRTHESQQGVGLGLAISRDLARGMGGDLTVASTPGAGSTFTLTLVAGA